MPLELDLTLDNLFEQLLEELRGSWDQGNASSILLSLFFYQGLWVLEREGRLDLVSHQGESLLKEAEHYLREGWDTRAAQVLKEALLLLAKENEVLENVFQPLLQAFEEEINLQPLALVLHRLVNWDWSWERLEEMRFGAFFAEKLHNSALHLGKQGEQWISPMWLNRLMAALLAPQAGQKVYDPAVGHGGSLLALHELCPDLKFGAQEVNRSTLAWCRMNLLMNGVSEAHLEGSDSLLKPLELQGGWADLAVANFPLAPPLASSLVKDKGYLCLPFDVRHTQEFNLYGLFIQLMLHQLNEHGRLAAVLPIAALYKDRQDRRLREYLLMHDWVESVITLPQGLLYSTGVPICLVLINKAKPEARRGRIRFINASQLEPQGNSRLHRRSLSDEQLACLVEAFHASNLSEVNCGFLLRDCLADVPLAEVSNQQYNLNSKRYASPFIKELRRLELKYPVLPLSQLFEFDPPYVWFDASFQRHFPYVRVEDLAVSFGDYPVELDKLISTQAVKEAEGRLVMQSVLLIAKNSKELRLGYFVFDKEPIVVHTDIMVFSINEDRVHLEYLLLQMFSDLFWQQLQIYRSDHEDQSIHEREFGQLQVFLPSRLDQEKEARETKVRLLREEERKVEDLRLRLNLDKQQAQTEQHKVISSLQHELGNRLPALLGDFRILKEYLSEKIAEQAPLTWKEPILPLFEDEDPAQVDKLETIIQRMEALIRYGIGAIDATGDIIKADRSKMRLERVEVRALLEEVRNLYQHERNFSIQIEIEEDEKGQEQCLALSADRAQLLTALVNLVENAKKHGFSSNKKYLIRFNAGLSPDKKEILILYKNDGKPFPARYSFDDFISYGNYAGQTGHSGIGGYLVHRIVDNHDGQLTLLEDIPKNDPFKVQFELSLPMWRD